MNLYLAGSLVAVILVAGAGAFYAGKKIGIAESDRAAQAALANWHKREAELVAAVQEAGETEAIKVIYRDRIKTIEKATGECLDTRLPDDIVRSLQ